MSGRHTRHCDPAGFHCQYLIDLTVSKQAMKFLPDPIQKSNIKLMIQKIVYFDDLCPDRYTFCQYLFLSLPHLLLYREYHYPSFQSCSAGEPSYT